MGSSLYTDVTVYLYHAEEALKKVQPKLATYHREFADHEMIAFMTRIKAMRENCIQKGRTRIAGEDIEALKLLFNDYKAMTLTLANWAAANIPKPAIDPATLEADTSKLSIDQEGRFDKFRAVTAELVPATRNLVEMMKKLGLNPMSHRQ